MAEQETGGGAHLAPALKRQRHQCHNDRRITNNQQENKKDWKRQEKREQKQKQKKGSPTAKKTNVAEAVDLVNRPFGWQVGR